MQHTKNKNCVFGNNQFTIAHLGFTLGNITIQNYTAGSRHTFLYGINHLRQYSMNRLRSQMKAKLLETDH